MKVIFKLLFLFHLYHSKTIKTCPDLPEKLTLNGTLVVIRNETTNQDDYKFRLICADKKILKLHRKNLDFFQLTCNKKLNTFNYEDMVPEFGVCAKRKNFDTILIIGGCAVGFVLVLGLIIKSFQGRHYNKRSVNQLKRKYKFYKNQQVYIF